MPVGKKELQSWDLTDLYAGIGDAGIEKDLEQLDKQVKVFEVSYRGIIKDGLSAQTLRGILDEYSAMIEKIRKLEVYATLEHSTHVDVEEYGAFYQHIATITADLLGQLIFLETDLIKLSDKKLLGLVKENVLLPYRHYLERKVLQKKHYLSEDLERVLQQKSLTGRQAWNRLHTQKLVRQRMPFVVKGKRQQVSVDYLLHQLFDGRRAWRKKAMVGVGEIAAVTASDNAFIYNTLMQDFAQDAKLRNFEIPEDMRHVENELERPAVAALVKVVIDHYGLVQDYYRFKKQAMGVKQLYDYDKYAPLVLNKKKYSYDQARMLVGEAFGDFSPQFAEIAELFFANKWIDATPTSHKQGGAYCMYSTPGTHPYVFMNFQGGLEDVSTLAHELGHAINAYLGKEQNILEYDWPLPIAETASVFAEMLLFKRVVQQEKDAAKKLALYMWKIESLFATVFRQISMYRFEQEAHAKRRTEGELSSGQLQDLWQDQQKEMFGRSLTFSKNQENFWGLVPHFFHTPFYVYAYAFGQLLTLSLFSLYEKDQAGFVEKYTSFMRMSGTKSPHHLVKVFGVDIDTDAFWQQGINEICSLFEEAKKLQQ